MISRLRILFHENLTNSWSIAVDPRVGIRFLFLIDRDKNSRIEPCSMDGWQCISIANDSIHEEVYFTDHYLNYIEVIVVSYNGENRRKILANTHFLHGLISITPFENNLYWYDSNSDRVRRLNCFEHEIKTQKHKRILSKSRMNHMKILYRIYQSSGKL
jgi:hypothetical protein